MISILPIHSDKELQKFIKASLEGIPAKLLPSCSALSEVHEVFKTEQAQILILDLFVPERSGLDLLKPLRKFSDTIVIILLARMRTRSLIERAFRFGANDVIPYPVSQEMFRNTVLHRLKTLKEQEILTKAENAQSGGAETQTKQKA